MILSTLYLLQNRQKIDYEVYEEVSEDYILSM